jgi:hypothetical protein
LSSKKKISDNSKSGNNYNTVNNSREAALKLMRLPKSNFHSIGEQSTTQSVFAKNISYQGDTTIDDSPNLTNDYYKNKYDEARFEGLQDKLEAKITNDISNIRNDLKDEITNFKGNTIKYVCSIVIPIIIAFIIALLTYHFTIFDSLKNDLNEDLSKSIDFKFKTLKSEIKDFGFNLSKLEKTDSGKITQKSGK